MNRNIRRTRKNQAGLGLIELMIAIGIALVIAAITLGVAAQVRADNKINQLQTQIVQVASQAQSLGSGTNYEGVDTAMLINGKKVPANWVIEADGSSEIRHAFDATIVVGDNSGALEVTINDIPVGACTTVVNNTLANFRAITIGSTELKAGDSNPGDIATACADGATDDLVNLVISA